MASNPPPVSKSRSIYFPFRNLQTSGRTPAMLTPHLAQVTPPSTISPTQQCSLLTLPNELLDEIVSNLVPTDHPVNHLLLITTDERRTSSSFFRLKTKAEDGFTPDTLIYLTGPSSRTCDLQSVALTCHHLRIIASPLIASERKLEETIREECVACGKSLRVCGEDGRWMLDRKPNVDIPFSTRQALITFWTWLDSKKKEGKPSTW